MKKYILFSALSLAMLGWSACQEENEAALNVAPNGKSLTFTASVSGSNSLSKTAVAANGKSIVFADDEQMTVFPNVGGSFTISNSADNVNSFSGVAGDEAYFNATSFVAMYPSGGCDNGDLVMFIPEAQNVVSGSFDPKANLLIAETSSKDMTLQMHNVCSYIKVNISAEASFITVTADQPLAGKVSVSADGSAKMLKGEDAVTLSGNITPGAYYIAVMPGKFTNLKITTDNKDIKPIEVAEFEFVRGQIHGVGIDAVKLLSPADIVDYVNASDEEIVTLNMALETYDHTEVLMAFDKIRDKKVKLVIPEGVKELGIDWQKIEMDGNIIMVPHPSALVDVVIPESVETIGGSAFEGCSSLTSITIPESVTTIGSDAFRGCSSLTNITIPESVTEIGNGTFSLCSSLTSVTILEGVPVIGEFAFSDCSSLASVTIPEGVTTIPKGLFMNCKNLTSIIIPESVTEIGNYTFCNCSSLTSIIIPESVNQIGAFVFQLCDNLETIYCSQAIYDKYHDQYPQMVLYDGTKPFEAIDLTEEMFYSWTAADASGEKVDYADCVYELEESTGMVYGTGAVSNKMYADLSEFNMLEITLIDDSEEYDGEIFHPMPRPLLNRDIDEGYAPDHLIDCGHNYDQREAYMSVMRDNGDGTITYVVDIAKIVADYGYAHLQSIKGVNWRLITVTSMKLYK